MGPLNTSRQDSLARAVREAGIDVPPAWFDEVGSTNEEAGRLAHEGAPGWTVVVAGHQTAGRGRLERSWLDVPGSSLLCSVILRPRLGPEEVPVISLAAAVSVIDAAGLRGLAAKWPNDLVVGERKCGGILAEAEVVPGAVRHVVLGVGVNVGMGPEDLPEEIAKTATSLAIEGIVMDLDVVLGRFLSSLRGLLESPRPARDIVDAYRPLCETLGRPVRATTVTGERIEGRAVEVDNRGGLVIQREGTVHRVAFGEVTHVGTPRRKPRLPPRPRRGAR